jgi:hypothetical protein
VNSTSEHAVAAHAHHFVDSNHYISCLHPSKGAAKCTSSSQCQIHFIGTLLTTQTCNRRRSSQCISHQSNQPPATLHCSKAPLLHILIHLGTKVFATDAHTLSPQDSSSYFCCSVYERFSAMPLHCCCALAKVVGAVFCGALCIVFCGVLWRSRITHFHPVDATRATSLSRTSTKHLAPWPTSCLWLCPKGFSIKM